VEGGTLVTTLLPIERRIRIAAALVLIGIAIEAVSLRILHPLSFVAFAAFGALAIGAGILVYLLALLRAVEPGTTGDAARGEPGGRVA
jgi:hypothetical protein